jgi:hypothetical protein
VHAARKAFQITAELLEKGREFRLWKLAMALPFARDWLLPQRKMNFPERCVHLFALLSRSLPVRV